MTNLIELPVQRMSAAEFKVGRERLGLTATWVATQLGVTDRSVARWEAGEMPVSRDAEALIDRVHTYTNRLVLTTVRKLKLPKNAKPGDAVVLFTFRRDEDMAPEGVWINQEDGPLPASWHRAMIGRVALITDLPVQIEYIAN